MRLGSWQFSPKPWAFFLFLGLFVCMLLLGKWQIGRAALKVSMQEAAAQALQSPPLALEAVADVIQAADSYQRIQLSGHYATDRQFLWDNRTSAGRAGFEVIIPLKLDTGSWVLINRGWVVSGVTREPLPDVSLSDSLASERVAMEGILSRPSKGFASGPALSAGALWPKLLQYMDYDAISDVLGGDVLPVLVQPQSLGTDGVTVQVLSSRPEWLKANWQPAASGPAKHYSYAFQWFAMATALTILFIVLNSKRISESGVEPD